MAICARTIGRIDTVDPPVKMRHTLIDIIGICRVRRVEFGCYGKLAPTQDTLKPTARGMLGKFR